MLFSLVPEQTVYFLKPVGQAGLLHQSLAAICCFCSILWKPAGKSHAVVPGAMQRQKKSHSLPQRELSQKRQTLIGLFHFLLHSMQFLLYCISAYFLLYFLQHLLFFLLSPPTATDCTTQFTVVVCPLCIFLFLTLFHNKVSPLICCTPLTYLESLLSIQTNMNLGHSTVGPICGELNMVIGACNKRQPWSARTKSVFLLLFCSPLTDAIWSWCTSFLPGRNL